MTRSGPGRGTMVSAVNRSFRKAVIGLLLVGGTSWGHTFHDTFAEVNWNAETARFEIAVRVWPEDLDATCHGWPDDERRVARYVMERFCVNVTDEEIGPGTMTWIGMEYSPKEAWLFFEAEVPSDNSVVECSLSNRMFFELREDQANFVRLRVGAARRTLRCTRFEPAFSLAGGDVSSHGSGSRAIRTGNR